MIFKNMMTLDIERFTTHIHDRAKFLHHKEHKVCLKYPLKLFLVLVLGSLPFHPKVLNQLISECVRVNVVLKQSLVDSIKQYFFVLKA